MITLYSNHCVRCEILRSKLDSKKIEYNLIDDVDTLIQKGFENSPFPILEVDGNCMPFMEANNYVNSL